MISSLLATVGLGLQILASAVWSGGILYFFAILAPLAFRECGNRWRAADLIASCLHRFHHWEAICALVSLCGSGILYVADVRSVYLWLDVAIAVTMFLVFIFYGGWLTPKLDALRIELREAELYGREPEPGKVQSFYVWHRWYERSLLVNVLLGVTLLVILTLLAGLRGAPSSMGLGDTMLFGGNMAPWP